MYFAFAINLVLMPSSTSLEIEQLLCRGDKVTEKLGLFLYTIKGTTEKTEVKKMVKEKVIRYAVINQKECVACGTCVKVCPKSTLSIPKGIYAEVDLEKCVGCSLCAKVCPASVIEIEKRTISELQV